jgi:hypothetical protein
LSQKLSKVVACPLLLDRHVILTDGRRLGYAEYGDRKGRPLLFFPGTPHSRWSAPYDEAWIASAGIRFITPSSAPASGSRTSNRSDACSIGPPMSPSSRIRSACHDSFWPGLREAVPRGLRAFLSRTASGDCNRGRFWSNGRTRRHGWDGVEQEISGVVVSSGTEPTGMDRRRSPSASPSGVDLRLHEARHGARCRGSCRELG